MSNGRCYGIDGVIEHKKEVGIPRFSATVGSPRPVDLGICTNGLVNFILLPTCNDVRRNPCPNAHPRAYTIARLSNLLSVVAATLMLYTAQQ